MAVSASSPLVLQKRADFFKAGLCFLGCPRRSLHSFKFAGHNLPRLASIAMLAYNTSSDLRLPSVFSPDVLLEQY